MEAAPLLGPVGPEAVQDSLFNTTNSSEFTAAHRLLRSDGFDHVVQAENVTNTLYKIFFVHNGTKNARLGIIASKRILSGAVQRNRVKRLIREAFRQHSIKFKLIDLVVMVKGVDTLASQSKDLNTLFSRIEEKCASL
ncbi:MAG: ribonuclease P protein component [Gallionella sp.]